ncbi:hypothetical protein [Halobellus inordinatus]|uniref:hypothetical protein n=1 Tax=Halobellus inordinatus TaxID=1126236 RepID=UPI002109FCF2|nr:hypothetical protein [Halobellus inordinatus]
MTADPRVELYESLAATAELPVDRTPSRVLGEAESIASDLRDIDDPTVAAGRAQTIVDLLAEIDETGNSEADAHVDRARELAIQLSDQ